MRASKIVIAEPLMKRSRTFSPGLNRPVQLSVGPAAVHQEGVARDVGQVGRVHAHLAPHQAVGDDGLPFLRRLRSAEIAHQAGQGAPAVVEVARLLLQLAQDGAGRHRMVVAQHHDVVARDLVALAFAPAR